MPAMPTDAMIFTYVVVAFRFFIVTNAIHTNISPIRIMPHRFRVGIGSIGVTVTVASAVTVPSAFVAVRV